MLYRKSRSKLKFLDSAKTIFIFSGDRYIDPLREPKDGFDDTYWFLNTSPLKQSTLQTHM